MYTYTSDTIRYEYTRFYIHDLMIYLIDWLRRSCWPRPGTDAVALVATSLAETTTSLAIQMEVS